MGETGWSRFKVMTGSIQAAKTLGSANIDYFPAATPDMETRRHEL